MDLDDFDELQGIEDDDVDAPADYDDCDSDSDSEYTHPNDPYAIVIPQGRGTKLGDIVEINNRIDFIDDMDLECLHDLMFNCIRSETKMRKNLRQFSGFAFQRDSPQYDNKARRLFRVQQNFLKSQCSQLDLKRGGSSHVLATRLLDFLMNPTLEQTMHGRSLTSSKAKRRKVGVIDQEVAEATGVHVSLLPPEIIQKIFGYLNPRVLGRVARVCVDWRDKVYWPPLWRNGVATWRLFSRDTTLMPSLLRRRVPKVDVYINPDRLTFRMDISNPKVIKLNTHMTKNSFKTVLLPFMEFLESLGALAYQIDDNVLIDVIGNIPTLRKLDLRQCRQISSSALTSYFRGEYSDSKQALEDLSLHDADISTYSIRVLQEEMPGLKRLDLSHNKLDEGDMEHISDMVQLEELILNGNKFEITSFGFNQLATGKAKIVTLKLIECPLLVDNHLECLARMPHLKHLNISSTTITDVGLVNLVSVESKITTLNISGCKNITDEGLKMLYKMVELNDLHVTYCDMITSAGLVYLARGYSRIPDLIISICQRIYSQSKESIEKGVFELLNVFDNKSRYNDEYSLHNIEVYLTSKINATIKVR